ncbi:MAG: outer membrane protein assembly factor BamA [Tannerella sp.]|jgi:outer membrane protein insertion porin family|nr:outer membrane protein assembly factor BamA [Tannerella sp.]
MSIKIRLILAFTGLMILKGYAQIDTTRVESAAFSSDFTQPDSVRTQPIISTSGDISSDTIPANRAIPINTSLIVDTTYLDDVIPPDEVPTISYQSRKKYTIADIKIKMLGPNNYEDYVLVGISGLAVGDVVDVPGDELSEATRRFWRHGLFSDVIISALRVKDDKVWLEIQLRQRPRISEINFNGVKKGEREELTTRLGLRKGSTLTTNAADRAKTLIQKYFDQKGFKNVEVEIVQKDDLSKEGEMIVDVNINKNQKTKIEEIVIEGNEAVSDFTLKQAMKKTNEKFSLPKRLKTSILEIFSTKKFTSEEYENDKKNLINKYNEFGYRDAIILSDSVENVSDKYVKIYLTVDEGQKYYFKDIQFVGNTKYASELLETVLNIKPGDVYNTKKLDDRLNQDDDAVANIYYNNGYLFFGADPIEVDVQNDSISLEIRIQEGPQATINKIIINGNDRLYEDIVRRELRTKPGQLFSKEDLVRSVRELAQMGHFDPENMNPVPQPNIENGTVDIQYNLVSKANDQVEVSAGWGQTGVIGKLALKFTNFSMKNLFHPGTYKGIIPQGEGETFTISGQASAQNYQSYSISYMDPWFGGKRPNMFSVSLYYAKYTGMNSSYLQQQMSQYGGYNPYYGYGGMGGGSGYGYGYDSGLYEGIYESAYDPSKYMQMIGATIGFGKRLSWPDDYFQFSATFNYQMYRMKNWSGYFIISDGVAHKFSLDFVLQRNSIDNPLYTRYGSQFLGSLSVTPPYSLFDGKDYASMTDNAEINKLIEYHKWKFSGKVFFPLLPLPANNGPKRTPVFMTRAEFGFLGYFNKHKTNYFETFQVGGDGMSGYQSYYAVDIIGLRGYENGSLSGTQNAFVQYGRAYTRMTMELRYPLILEPSSTIYALGFLEAGNAWGSVAEFHPFDLKRSAGFGVRIFLPMIGMMGIDWGYGFDTPYGSQQKGGSQFHFILGQEF